jgi:hypothetical protein
LGLDNASTVAPGTGVNFPEQGPVDGSGLITGIAGSIFRLTSPGTYEITFQVPVTEQGQLVVVLNGTELPYTVVGRATATSQIVGESLVTTTLPDSTIQIENPAGNSTALTITPLAGGEQSASASLIIERLH